MEVLVHDQLALLWQHIMTRACGGAKPLILWLEHEKERKKVRPPIRPTS